MVRRGRIALWLSLLPAGERERLHDRLDEEVPTVPVSWALAIVQLSLIPIWALQGLAYCRQVASAQGDAILHTTGTVTSWHTQLASIALGPFAYLFSLQGLVLEYVIVTGLARAAGLVTSSRPTGDPLVSLVAWLRRTTDATVTRRRRLRRLGPERPDRIVRAGERELVVVCSREKPDWNARVTIQHGDALYRLARTEERHHGRFIDIVYVLRPRDPSEVIRALVTLEESTATTAPAPHGEPRAGDGAAEHTQ